MKSEAAQEQLSLSESKHPASIGRLLSLIFSFCSLFALLLDTALRLSSPFF
jgi:hypothetical protein